MASKLRKVNEFIKLDLLANTRLWQTAVDNGYGDCGDYYTLADGATDEEFVTAATIELAEIVATGLVEVMVEGWQVGAHITEGEEVLVDTEGALWITGRQFDRLFC